MNDLNFNILYDVENTLLQIHNVMTTEDLTPSLKEDILNISAIQVSRILELYWRVNNRKVDYNNKKVYLDNGITMDYNCYEDYIKRLHRAYNDCVDIQKTILGEDEYARRVYAQTN